MTAHQGLVVEDALSLLDEVRGLMAATKDDLGVREMPATDGHIIWLFARAWSTVGAILLLLRSAYLDASMSLARGLFTDTLRMMELAAAGSGRAGLVLGWAREGLNDLEGVAREAERTGVDRDPAQIRQWIDGQRAKIARAQERLGTPRLPQFDTEKDLARRHDLAEEYVDYRFGHLFVHGSPVVMGFRSVQTPDGTMGFAERQEGAADSIIGTALLTAQCGLLSLRAFQAIFAIAGAARIGDLLAAINSEAARRNMGARSAPASSPVDGTAPEAEVEHRGG